MTSRFDIPARPAMITVAGLLVALAASVSSLPAQSSAVDPRWQGWLGCWRPAAAPLPGETDSLGTPLVDVYAPLLCVVPSGESSVDMITVADGKVLARETIDASGTDRSRVRDGCTGTESARWSDDARRVYLKSEYACPGALTRRSNGVLAISTEGELLDVQGVATGAGKQVRVARYRDAGVPQSLPATIADAIGGRAMAVGASRTAAAAPITETEIVDASRNLDAQVVQAWLIESGQPFSVDAKAVVRLARAGVPGSVTDALVALSYPHVFAVNRATFASTLRPMPGGPQVAGVPRTIHADVFPPNVGGYYNGYYNPYYYGYSPFAYSPFGYGGYAGYGAYPYGGGPVIVIRDNGPAARHGRVVNGRGYSRDDPSAPDAIPRSEPRSAQPTTSTSSGSSGSPSSGSSSSGSSSSGGERKAKPRP